MSEIGTAQALYDAITNDDAMMGPDYVDSTYYRYEDMRPTSRIPRAPDLSRGQAIAALMDCIIEQRPYSVAIRRAEPTFEQYEQMAASGVTSIAAE